MQKKYFKCYFCETGNSDVVPIDQKGKECRCCQAYNYFYNNNQPKNFNINNHNKNNYNITSNNNIYHNNRNHNYNYNNTSYNNRNHNNNNYNYNKNYKKKKNIANTNNSNRQENNRRYQRHQIRHFDLDINRLINRLSLNDNIRRENNNQLEINNNKDNIIEEKKDKIKYSWLKKEKLSEEMANKKKDGYECSICLETIKLNEDINILKCGHLFHYKCIESLVDHHLDCCPNCRCDIKTGKKQSNNQNNNHDLFMSLGFNLDFGNIIPIYDEDDFDDSFDIYDY